MNMAASRVVVVGRCACLATMLAIVMSTGCATNLPVASRSDTERFLGVEQAEAKTPDVLRAQRAENVP